MVQKVAPFFSIVVPVYNRANFIPELIQSVLNQRFGHFELIIVNDGSTDATETIVQRYSDSRIKYLRIENSERGAARNAGADIAQGEYLNFFDSDDQMLPNHLAVARSFITEMNEPEWFHTGYIIVNENGEHLFQENGERNNPEKRLIITNYLGCDSVFIKKELFLKTRFNPNRILASSEDWELWLRVISRAKLLVCNEVTFQMVHHANRSLLTISPDRIIERDNFMVQSLLADDAFKRKFSSYLLIFQADRYTFFSLTLILAGRRSEAIHFLLQSLFATVTVLKRRRFWACAKHIFISYFK